MKKVILLLFVSSMSFWAMAQNLELFTDGLLLEDNAEITVHMHPDSGWYELEAIAVKNTLEDPVLVRCIRENIDTLAFTENKFCWGMCFSSHIDTSTVAVKIEWDELKAGFIGEYHAHGVEGSSLIKYTFYDVADEENRVSVFVRYNATTELGIEDVTTFKLSAAYPNPADNFVNFDYELSNNSGNVSVVIYNLLGSKVIEINVLEYQGSLRLSTSDLIEGIYFYSLLINNEPVRTQKLIIKH